MITRFWTRKKVEKVTRPTLIEDLTFLQLCMYSPIRMRTNRTFRNANTAATFIHRMSNTKFRSKTPSCYILVCPNHAHISFTFSKDLSKYGVRKYTAPYVPFELDTMTSFSSNNLM